MEDCFTPSYKFKKFITINCITLRTINLNTGYTIGHLSLVFNEKRPLSEKMRAKLNAYLNTDF